MATDSASASTKIRVALTLPFGAAEVADYLFSKDTIAYWLGSVCDLRACLDTAVYLTQVKASAPPSARDKTDYSPTGRVVVLSWPATKGAASPAGTYELVVALDESPATSQVIFRICPQPQGTCRLRIEHKGLVGAEQRRASLKAWQSALRRVSRIMHLSWQNLRHERQAIIVVHGIGEARPGQMLREFVSNVFKQDVGEIHFVKPDYLSSLFEMRMATVPRSDAYRPTTDVFELYWAHLIRDTTITQVYSWMLRLIFSRDSRIPKTLNRVVWLARVLLFAALIGFGWLMTKDVSGWLKAIGGGVLVSLPAIGSLALKTLRDDYIIGYAGDAARYLEPRPDNIPRRQEIRKAGADILDALHDTGRYSRIIVYGHSLGSVVAYDILNHAWALRSRDREPVPKTSSRALLALEDMLNPRSGQGTHRSIEDIQTMQYEAWREYRRNGFSWRVTDFVTAGSPLAHAPWLLNLDEKTEFPDLVRDRSFPTCPPQTELTKTPVANILRNAFTFTHAYQDLTDRRKTRSVLVPHHAGSFALTRWTNLFFPYKGLLNGDPVAGPLSGCLGHWIRDIRLNQTTTGFAHCRYSNRLLEDQAVEAVRNALNLPFRRSLTEYAPEQL